MFFLLLRIAPRTLPLSTFNQFQQPVPPQLFTFSLNNSKQNARNSTRSVLLLRGAVAGTNVLARQLVCLSRSTAAFKSTSTRQQQQLQLQRAFVARGGPQRGCRSTRARSGAQASIALPCIIA